MDLYTNSQTHFQVVHHSHPREEEGTIEEEEEDMVEEEDGIIDGTELKIPPQHPLQLPRINNHKENTTPKVKQIQRS